MLPTYDSKLTKIGTRRRKSDRKEYGAYLKSNDSRSSYGRPVKPVGSPHAALQFLGILRLADIFPEPMDTKEPESIFISLFNVLRIPSIIILRK